MCEPLCMWQWDSELNKSLLALFRKWRRFTRSVCTEEHLKRMDLRYFCDDMAIAISQLAPVDGMPYMRDEGEVAGDHDAPLARR